MSRNMFTELSKAKISPQRNLVISRNTNMHNYTIAQQIVVNEGNESTSLFMKGAIHIESLDGLYNLRDALNDAISQEEAEAEIKNF